MYWVYIIYCKPFDKFYIGYSEDPNQRLIGHNEGINRSTKYGAPHWGLVYIEPYPTRIEAMIREKSIKARKNKDYIRSLVQSINL